ncbi:polyadenylate-binding protein 4-like isoform X1 [Selaginella moellendorffii]|uniref:polyadenylate-binding protein 4-like isoform X1 n=1 Tax=Selaginella moellendorffii TaxID=88036 RepID=UPI000D1CC6B4|nr:polyadenylate-binding protein 4-like isoform X1 [Selaginella moellendorffii]|eukprot:XP_024530483.1 polyadenylate-binding protein 4-like isoform X1 [Selaginella moellendorffii]
MAAVMAATTASPAAAAAAPADTSPPPPPPPAVPGVAAPSGVSLYVGDLDETVAETQLFTIFSQMGLVTSVRVCRDAVTRRSLGYGYVNYSSGADAVRAMEALNYTPINGKTIRIMWSHRDPSTRKSGVGNIFIKNLDESIDNKALHDTFIAFGPILSCKIAHQDGRSKGYGFVHFETDEAANLAIEKVNGMQLVGKKVFVAKFVKRSDRLAATGETKFTNVFVKNLDPEMAEEEINEHFSTFGVITNVVIMKDENDKSKGFGFVNFDDPEAARAAVETMNNSQLGSRTIYVGRAQKKAEREQILRRQFEEKRMEQFQKYQGANLYVKNLDDSIDDETLKQEFSRYGNITSAKVMRDEKGISKGFGFVCFTSPEEASRAATETNGLMINGKPIYVAMAQRKEIRQAQLQQQYAQRMSGLMPPPGAQVAAAYPPVYYAAPPALLPQVPQRQGLMYQPVMRPGWRTGPLAPPGRPSLQPLPPYALVPNAQRQQRQVRNRPPGGQPLAQIPQLQIPQPQAIQPGGYKENGRNQQQRPRQAMKYVNNGRPRDGAAAGGPVLMVPGNMPMGGNDVLSMMSAASPQQQKQLLGERLFPLVRTHQFDLAGKITGMLLEMDNSELLVLLETPEALASKVDEAVQVLQQHSKASTVPSSPLAEVPVA